MGSRSAGAKKGERKENGGQHQLSAQLKFLQQSFEERREGGFGFKAGTAKKSKLSFRPL